MSGGLELLPLDRDAANGPSYLHQLARIHVLTGHPDEAVEILQENLATPYFVSRAWLRIDPNFAPLHGHPRFEALVGDDGRGRTEASVAEASWKR